MLEPFVTDRLSLRRLKPEDAASVFAYASDPEMTSYVSWDAHKSIDDSLSYISYAMDNVDKQLIDLFAITLKDNPAQVIGTISIEIKGKGEGELAYSLGRQYWRQGIMYEASHALIERAFNAYNLERIFATCKPPNIASKSLMLKLGMSYEGTLRSKVFIKGQYWDLEYYSILCNEWQNKV